VGEGTVAVVHVKGVGADVVGEVEVGPAVVVNVAPGLAYAEVDGAVGGGEAGVGRFVAEHGWAGRLGFSGRICYRSKEKDKY
jgi:hypothetical protein